MSIDKIKSRKLKKDSEIIEKKSVTKKKKTLDDVLGKVDSSRSVAVERRVHLANKSLKGRKIKASNVGLEEKKLDKEIENEDNLSVMMMIFILVACFVVGGILGYMLYRIAMNSSNALFIISSFFK